MKKSLVILFLLSSLGLADSVFKIGYVDIQKVFDEYNDAQSTLKTLEEELKEKELSLQTLKLEIEKLELNLKQQQAMLSNESKDKKKKEIEEKKLNLTKLAQQYQEELKQKSEEAQKKYLQEIQNAIKVVGQKENYNIIVERNTVLYAKEEFNISKTIAQYLNSKKEEKK